MKQAIKLMAIVAVMSLVNLGLAGQEVARVSGIQLSGVETDAQGRTALMRAAYEGNLDQARSLLSDPANSAWINYQDNNDKTALMYAAGYGKNISEIMAMVKLLESYGADATARDHKGRNAIDYLLRWNPYIQRTNMVGKMLSRRDGGDSLRLCLEWGQECGSKSTTCVQSEPFCVGNECVFICTQMSWDVENCWGDTCDLIGRVADTDHLHDWQLPNNSWQD